MKALLLNDIHLPYEHKKAWKMTCILARVLEPDLVFFDGDVDDFEPISRFVTKPRKRLELQSQLDYAFEKKMELRELTPNARWFLKAGNHEQRLEKYLYTEAKELSDLRTLKLDQLLQLKALETTFIPWGQNHSIGKLHIIHGDEIKHGWKHPAESLFNKVNVNIYCAHHHVFDRFTHRSLDNSHHGAWTGGCLCGLNPIWAPLTQWELGVTLGQFTKSGLFHLDQIIYMIEGSKLHAMVNGVLYSV